MSFLFYFLIFMTFAITYGRPDTFFHYVLIIGCVGLGVFRLGMLLGLRRRALTIPRLLRGSVAKAVPFYLPLVLFLCWVYGATLGIVNQIPVQDVFRNFAGLVVYLFFYALWLYRPKLSTVLVLLLSAVIVQVFYGMLGSLQLLTSRASIMGLGSVSDLRAYYSTGLLLCFPLISAWLFARNNYANPDLKLPRVARALLKSKVLFATMCYAVLIPAMSKGFMLAFGTLIAIYLAYLFFRSFRSVHYLAGLGLIVFLGIGVSLFLPREFFELLFFSFSSQEASNAVRAQQLPELVSDLKVMGNGLGAPLASGYARRTTAYGFELTYVNLLHKLGIFAVPLFLSYLLVLGTSLYRLFRGVKVLTSALALGCMMYMIPGIGNPILLAPHFVVLHCIAIYILFYTEEPHRSAIIARQASASANPQPRPAPSIPAHLTGYSK
jgi:hypothetical protein